MTSEVLISAEGLGKKFCRSLKKSIYYGVSDVLADFLNKSHDPEELRPQEFWALHNVSFELRRGECLGLIGPNGSGKSTLLKLLNGIILPDQGTVKIRGRVAALLELGAGFHPMLTGRENVFLMGSIYGMSNAELQEKYESIVSFSELGEFIESPVKYYSSGMRVRLGFSIAIHLEPDILFLDEVLAVGDVGFRIKCLNAIGKLQRNAAVIIVSHSMPQIARMSDRVMVLKEGNIVKLTNDVPDSISEYYSLFTTQPGVKTVTKSRTSEILAARIQGRDGETFPSIAGEESLKIEVDLHIDEAHHDTNIFVGILNQELQLVAQASTEWDNIQLKAGTSTVELDINNLHLNPSKYFLLLTLMNHDHTEVLSQHYAVQGFFVEGKDIAYSSLLIRPEWQIREKSN
jgi:lipopolysaccharide transport system ATP-binding protein